MLALAMALVPLAGPPVADPHAAARSLMVERHLKGRDIFNPHVLRAMAKVPRHEFVPEAQRERAYADRPLPIGLRQTISQPYIVALMTQLVDARPGLRALDVGTGSGYQAAVLAEIVGKVKSIEILCPLADQARARLKRLGYAGVEVRCGDGFGGWPEAAPFDLIIVAAAPTTTPPKLIEQLAPGGALVIPVGDEVQSLRVVRKDKDGKVKEEDAGGVRFVPMTGKAQQPR